MTDSLLILLISLITLVVGFFLGNLISALKHKAKSATSTEQNFQLKHQLEESNDRFTNMLEENKNLRIEEKREFEFQIEKIENEREILRKDRDILSNELTRRNSEYESLQQKNLEYRTEVEELQKKFETQFENLANRILDEKSQKFTSLNKENLQNLLNPLSEKIKSFEEKVNKNNVDFIDRHAQLGQYLKTLNEQSVKISEEANNLTKALKGENKTQGNWGELILEKVLEKSGLEKDREYFVQKAYTDDVGNRFLPDVIIHLPNERKMVIDSKVSLVAYEKYANEDEPSNKSRHLKDHIRSLHTHISQLSSKKYEDIYKTTSPDFVLMFIPVEPALYLAQNEDNSFFYTAFQKNILLVSPTTLLSTLRTIDTIWSNEKQQRNAIEIASHASSLY
ncbi:MAG TPA: DNA recombination protein RmuC, partial [Gillisia sp.]|nr:DNA recombination protein RmuC [Gillisia sp.]